MDHLKMYDRSSGCICFETELFNYANTYSTEHFVLRLQKSNVIWYWDSEPSHPDPEEYFNGIVPASRPLTKLDDTNAQELINDLGEFDLSGYGRFIRIFVTRTEIIECSLLSEIASFNAGNKSCLQAVIVLIGDSPTQFIFAPQQQNLERSQLLLLLGIDSQSTSIVNYKRLGVATLESIFSI